MTFLDDLEAISNDQSHDSFEQLAAKALAAVLPLLGAIAVWWLRRRKAARQAPASGPSGSA